MFELNKKKLVITGAGSGIGRAMALLFAKQGALVNILDKDAEGAARTTEMINKGQIGQPADSKMECISSVL